MTGGNDSSTGAGPTTNPPTTTNPTTSNGTDSGGPGGDCCAAHAAAGCDDMACQDAVCMQDQFCCAFEWDMGCADIAATACAGCGGMATDTGASTGAMDTGNPTGGMDDCCTPTPGTPGCAGNPPLETCVCAIDDFCCMMEWDQQCVNEAVQSCGAACRGAGGDCCMAGAAPGCSEATCVGEVCAIDGFCCGQQWDGICANQAAGICDVCGAGMGDCCVANPGTQGCMDDACVNAVCGEFGADPSCCTVEWTQACADLAAQDCAGCGGGGTGMGTGGGGGGDCCAPNGSPGCDDATCEAAVCAFDPFCCNTEWDAQCAGEAGMACPVLCGGGATGGGSGGGMFTCDVGAIAGCTDEDPATCTCEACDPGGGCQNSEDCTCPDCAADGFCSNPANCNNDGLCDPYFEGCVCGDCADHPLCP